MIRELILRWARNREPDFVIGGADRPYLNRHWLIPRNPFFNVYVHEFRRSDDDRALHDHPWLFNCSFILEGNYIEWVPSRRARGPFSQAQPCWCGQPLESCPECEFALRGADVGRYNPLVPECRFLKAGDWKFRWGAAPHRIQLHKAGAGELPCWTVFITGPRVRQWGFYCRRGWVHWKRFTAPHDKGSVGAGCDA